MAYLPLEGVRVLDLTRLIPGALTTKRLADFGAEVVKVEEPGVGDYLRRIPPLFDGEGVNHLLANRGKKSIAIDVKQPAQRETLLALCRVTDVIVEVSRPGRFQQLGVDFAALRDERPELVVCSVTGFGQTGPLEKLASHGLNMDAMAACITYKYEHGRPHLVAPIASSIPSEVGALEAALAITAAVYRARTSGEGAWIDASCWDAGVVMHRHSIAQLVRGEPDLWDALGPHPLYDLYETADTRLVLFCPIEQKFWANFCRGAERPDLETRWASANAVYHGDESLREELEPIFRTATADEWFDRFQQWDVPGSLVLDLDGVVHHPHFSARALVEWEDRDDIPYVNGSIRWMETGDRPGYRSRRASGLGADTDDVLARWLGHAVNQRHDSKGPRHGTG